MKKTKSKFRSAVIFILITGLLLTIILTVPKAEASTKTKSGNAWYTVIAEVDALAQYEKPASKTLKTVSVPNTVKIGNKTYKVASISKNAFKNNKKLKKVTIGQNVEWIGEKAFYGCKNLKTVTIKTLILEDDNVGADSFKKINSKAVVTVPLEKVDEYRKLLKNKGLTGKNQKVKGKEIQQETEEGGSNNNSSNYPDLSKSCFESESCFFNIRSDSSTSTSSYSVGDTIPFRTEFRLTPAVYGHWEEDSRKLYRGYVQCGMCNRCFSDFMLGLHSAMEQEPGGCYGHCLIGLDGAHPTTWAFVTDKTSCKVVLKYMFPEGISCKNGSVRVRGKVSEKDCTDSCIINISENELTVSIDDVKSEPFYTAFKYEEYEKDLYYKPDYNGVMEGFRDSIIIEFDTEVNSSFNTDGIITSTMSYYYKDTSHTNTYKISIHSASLKVSNTDTEGNDLSGAEFELYQKKVKYMEGMRQGAADWVLIKSGIHAGDVITALGTGTSTFENQYRLTQTKEPDGYKPANQVDFELFIDEDGTVRAEDSEGDALSVENGVVQVNVVNTAGKPYTGTTSVNENPVQDKPQTPDTGNSTDTPAAGSSASSGKKLVKVRATYYKDGEKECSMTYQQSVDQTETMMDKKEIRDRAYKFEGCRLEKITLNGVEVDSLPDKVEDKSEVCFYYVTN